LKLKIKFKSGEDRKYSLYKNGSEIENKSNCGETAEVSISNFYGIYKLTINSSCIISGTKLTLADGTKKNVEDITPEDQLLVFNHETGKVEVAPGYIIVRDDYSCYERTILCMHLSDDTTISICDAHRFYDVTLKEYVEIKYHNVDDYINHKLLKIKYENDNTIFEEVTFTSYEFVRMKVEIFSPVTFKNINIITDDLLTAAAGNLGGLFNYFEIGDNYQYDSEKMAEDILTYGLYTYEEFYQELPEEIQEFMTEELFECFNGQYFKVVIGKEIMSFEDIVSMILDYCSQLKEI
jgi:hypothetical protein